MMEMMEMGRRRRTTIMVAQSVELLETSVLVDFWAIGSVYDVAVDVVDNSPVPLLLW